MFARKLCVVAGLFLVLTAVPAQRDEEKPGWGCGLLMAGLVSAIGYWGYWSYWDTIPLPRNFEEIGRRPRRSDKWTLDRMEEVQAKLSAYKKNQGIYPVGLENSIAGPLHDFWRRPMLYRKVGDGYILFSVGRNGALDSIPSESDDLFVSGELDRNQFFEAIAAIRKELSKKR